MSFILDALRKSEKKRPEGAVPDLQTDHLAAGPQRASRRPVLLLLAGVLLVNGALLLWWQPWRANRPAPSSPESAVSLPAAPQPRAPSPVPQKSAPAEAAKPPMPPAPAPIAPPPADQSFAVGKTLIVPVSPDGPAEKAAAAAVIPFDEPSSFASPPADPGPQEVVPGVLALEDLPPSVRGGLPEFKFSLHYFTADPAQRMVRINGRILREGQELASGVELAEITPGGAIFTYRGMRFEVVRF